MRTISQAAIYRTSYCSDNMCTVPRTSLSRVEMTARYPCESWHGTSGTRAAHFTAPSVSSVSSYTNYVVWDQWMICAWIAKDFSISLVAEVNEGVPTPAFHLLVNLVIAFSNWLVRSTTKRHRRISIASTTL